MGLLLSFPPAGRKPLAKRLPDIPRQGADILFFTGIRYGRRNEPVANHDGNEPTRGAGGPQGRTRRRKAARN